MATKADFAKAAEQHGLLIAEHDGESMGVGERAELEALIADGILPEGTTLREATPSDF